MSGGGEYSFAEVVRLAGTEPENALGIIPRLALSDDEREATIEVLIASFVRRAIEETGVLEAGRVVADEMAMLRTLIEFREVEEVGATVILIDADEMFELNEQLGRSG